MCSSDSYGATINALNLSKSYETFQNNSICIFNNISYILQLIKSKAK